MCCNRALRQHLFQAALYAKAAIGCGNVSYLRKKTTMEQASFEAEAKFCFSCLRDKYMFKLWQSPRKGRKDGCNSSQNTLFHKVESVLRS